MKYQVIYSKPKKKVYTKQVATFYTPEDAVFWENVVKKQGCIDIEVIPVFSS